MTSVNTGEIGPTDPTLSPVAAEGARPGTFTLMERGWLPPLDQETQSYGLCFTADARVLLVADPGGWTLPGGTVEPGEALYRTLVREVAEEGCARVLDAEYLASQHVEDPGHPDARTSYYQSRWWARVALDRWEPRFETTARKLVAPEDVARAVSGRDTTVLSRLMEFALEVEFRRR